jgi:hypothetical protein
VIKDERASASLLDDSDNWQGGFYELAIRLGRRDDARLGRALEALWNAAGMQGCFAEGIGGAHLPAKVGLPSLAEHGHLRGVLEPPGFGRLVAGVFAIRFDNDCVDWLELYIPLGALAKVDPRIGGFPFGREGKNVSLRWRRGLDAWLAHVGRSVFDVVRFERALIGYEVDHDAMDRSAKRRMDAVLDLKGPALVYLEANSSPTSSGHLSLLARVRWRLESLARGLRPRR